MRTRIQSSRQEINQIFFIYPPLIYSVYMKETRGLCYSRDFSLHGNQELIMLMAEAKTGKRK